MLFSHANTHGTPFYWGFQPDTWKRWWRKDDFTWPPTVGSLSNPRLSISSTGSICISTKHGALASRWGKSLRIFSWVAPRGTNKSASDPWPMTELLWPIGLEKRSFSLCCTGFVPSITKFIRNREGWLPQKKYQKVDMLVVIPVGMLRFPATSIQLTLTVGARATWPPSLSQRWVDGKRNC